MGRRLRLVVPQLPSLRAGLFGHLLRSARSSMPGWMTLEESLRERRTAFTHQAQQLNHRAGYLPHRSLLTIMGVRTANARSSSMMRFSSNPN